jgi:hypothetical protein
MQEIIGNEIIGGIMKKVLYLILLMILICYGIADAAPRVDRYIIQWTTAVTGANDPPDVTNKNGVVQTTADYEIPTANARRISIKTDTALDAGSCTNTAGVGDWSLNVITKNDTLAEPYDTGTGTAYYHSYAGHADTLVQTQNGLTPGPAHIKFRADEDNATDLCLTIYVTVSWDK